MFEPIFYGWLLSSALLVAEHIGFADHPRRIPPPWTYIMGVLTLIAGCVVWARLTPGPVDPKDAVYAFVLISTSGGWVALGYLWRQWRDRRQHAAELRHDALRLTQDLIDLGGHDAARQSRDSDRVRKN